LKIVQKFSINNTAYNMGFSAMLAEEYILIVPFAIVCGSGWTNPGWPGQVSRATEYIINCINFTQSRMCGIRAEGTQNISTA